MAEQAGGRGGDGSLGVARRSLCGAGAPRPGLSPPLAEPSRDVKEEAAVRRAEVTAPVGTGLCPAPMFRLTPSLSGQKVAVFVLLLDLGQSVLNSVTFELSAVVKDRVERGTETQAGKEQNGSVVLCVPNARSVSVLVGTCVAAQAELASRGPQCRAG